MLLGRSSRNIVVVDVSFRFYGFAEWRGPRPGLGPGTWIGIDFEIEAGCNGREIRCQTKLWQCRSAYATHYICVKKKKYKAKKKTFRSVFIALRWAWLGLGSPARLIGLGGWHSHTIIQSYFTFIFPTACCMLHVLPARLIPTLKCQLIQHLLFHPVDLVFCTIVN